ncbi:MAG TPA: carboxylesterase/lipase family protein [Acidimicrobiales bacterium]|nr:carboxylesterase/lipase family protein [Acidimicrobiales bacterium]
MGGIVEVGGGRLRGVERNGIWSFSGIPYAAPPVGPLRWQPPLEAAPWAGIKECDHFGPIAPQTPPIPGMSIGGAPEEQSEDCLTLNIWSSRLGGEPRPVMVWIHGGGFNSGTGAGDLYRGGTLAREGDVIVVTINYRLGALGFLAHPALQPAPSGSSVSSVSSAWAAGQEWLGWGNWGIADQIAALVWVRDNIAAFGGDPGNVTVFGESAGGMSVSTLLGVGAARGLFHRAIVESGPPFTHSAEEAVGRAEALAENLGVPLTRQALEQVPASELVRAAQEVGNSLAMGDGGLPLAFLPTVDGGLLTRAPEVEVADGASADVPLLIGTNRDEAAFFALGLPAVNALDLPGLRRWVQRIVPSADSAETLIEGYRNARAARGEGTTPRDLWVAIATDSVFRGPSVLLADSHALAGSVGAAAEAPVTGPGTYVYLFTWETPAFGGLMGSAHALEIPFVFGTVINPVIQQFAGGGDDALRLSEGMRQAWISFAWTGSPSGELVGEWPMWDPIRRPTMVFGPWPGTEGMWRAVDAPRDEELLSLLTALPPSTIGSELAP